MRSRLLCLAVLWLGTSPAVMAASPANDDWRLVITPQFRVLSQLNADSTAKWIQSYQQFVAATAGALGIKTQSLPPLTIILFRSSKEYTPYKIARPDGRTANVAGQFARWPSWSVLAVAGSRVNEESLHTIYHEATHWLMSGDRARQPAWFSEGIAELLSTFEWNGSKVSWAKPLGHHLGLLNVRSPQPLDRFLLEQGAIFDREDRTALFYAQSWAFVHFMMLSGDAQRRDQMLRFLKLFKGQSGEATVKEVFGDNLPELQDAFLAYTRERRYPYVTLPAQRVADPPASVPAAPEDVEAGLGFLALGAGRSELAREHAQKALSLAPDRPGGRELMAYLSSEAEERDAMITHARAALRAGSRDPQMYVLMGDHQSADAGTDEESALTRRIAFYEQAINLDPLRLDIHLRLAEALVRHEKPRAEDRRFLELGLKFFPGEDYLQVAMASTDRRLGDRERALATLTSVLRPESTLDGAQRSFVEALRRSWWAEEMNTAVRAELDKRDYGSARRVIASFRARLAGDTMMEQFLAESDRSFALAELLEKAEQARRGGRTAEASSLAEQILAHPDVTPDQRRFAESLRRKSR